MFEKICKKFGNPDIDLFATRLNTQVKNFCSWEADPDCQFVNAFTIDWKQFTLPYLFPPFQHSEPLHQKNQGRSSRRNSGDTIMANTDMVFRRNVNRSTTTIIDKKKQNSTLLTNPKCYSSTLEPDNSDSMSCIRKSYENKGFSRKTSKILIASWRPGTRKQYQTSIRKWISYCSQREIDELYPSVNHVLDFLTYLYEEEKLGYSSINTARGALSAMLIKLDGTLAGSHPVVIRFLKGVYNLRPPLQTKPTYV